MSRSLLTESLNIGTPQQAFRAQSQHRIASDTFREELGRARRAGQRKAARRAAEARSAARESAAEESRSEPPPTAVNAVLAAPEPALQNAPVNACGADETQVDTRPALIHSDQVDQAAGHPGVTATDDTLQSQRDFELYGTPSASATPAAKSLESNTQEPDANNVATPPLTVTPLNVPAPQSLMPSRTEPSADQTAAALAMERRLVSPGRIKPALDDSANRGRSEQGNSHQPGTMPAVASVNATAAMSPAVGSFMTLVAESGQLQHSPVDKNVLPLWAAASSPGDEPMVTLDNLPDALASRLTDREWRVSLRLDPPELGRLRVDVSMQGDAINMRMQVASEDVRRLVESRLSQLHDVLGRHDLVVGRTDVIVHAHDAGESNMQHLRDPNQSFRQDRHSQDTNPQQHSDHEPAADRQAPWAVSVAHADPTRRGGMARPSTEWINLIA